MGEGGGEREGKEKGRRKEEKKNKLEKEERKGKKIVIMNNSGFLS